MNMNLWFDEKRARTGHYEHQLLDATIDGSSHSLSQTGSQDVAHKTSNVIIQKKKGRWEERCPVVTKTNFNNRIKNGSAHVRNRIRKGGKDLLDPSWCSLSSPCFIPHLIVWHHVICQKDDFILTFSCDTRSYVYRMRFLTEWMDEWMTEGRNWLDSRNGDEMRMMSLGFF